MGTVRHVRRRDVTPRAHRAGGVALAGAAGSVFVFGLALLATNRIEGAVRRSAVESIDEDARWVNVAVSGQRVELTGAEPEPGQGTHVIADVRSAQVDTWFGPLVPSTRVTAAFVAAAPVQVAATVPVTAPEAASPLHEPRRVAAEICESQLARALAQGLEFAGPSPTAAGEPVLDAVARAIADCPGRVRIEGHTDDRGDPGRNLALSGARAAAVRDGLIARGVASERLELAGFGSSRPLDRADTDEARARNARIEIHLAQAPGRP
ncbi:MAG: OmpA family protein [Myxococcota bacterium]